MTDLFEEFVKNNKDYVRAYLEKQYETVGDFAIIDFDHVWLNAPFDKGSFVGDTPKSKVKDDWGVKIPESRGIGFDLHTFEDVEIIAEDNISFDPKQRADRDIKEILEDVREQEDTQS